MAKIFLTNATGYIGAEVAKKALARGYDVSALARSNESANKLVQLGVEPVPGDLKEPEKYIEAVTNADIVIHTAATNDSDQGKYDTLTIESVIKALKGTGKTFVYTSGTWVLGDTGEELADETTPYNSLPLVQFREKNEKRIVDAAQQSIRSIVLRPVVVYGGTEGIVANLVSQAQESGKVIYVDNGDNYWSLVHLHDLAELYLLAIEKALSGTIFNACTEHLTSKVIAEYIAKAAKAEATSLPLDEARKVLSFFADAFSLDQKISSEKAKSELGWQPCAPGFAEELAKRYFVLTIGKV